MRLCLTTHISLLACVCDSSARFLGVPRESAVCAGCCGRRGDGRELRHALQHVKILDHQLPRRTDAQRLRMHTYSVAKQTRRTAVRDTERRCRNTWPVLMLMHVHAQARPCLHKVSTTRHYEINSPAAALMCGSTRESIESTKHVVFPLPLWACRPTATLGAKIKNKQSPQSISNNAA